MFMSSTCVLAEDHPGEPKLGFLLTKKKDTKEISVASVRRGQSKNWYFIVEGIFSKCRKINNDNASLNDNISES